MKAQEETATIRRAAPADAARLAALSEQLGYPASQEEIEARLAIILADPGHALLVAESPENGVAGWVHGFIRPLLVEGRHVEVGGLVVEESARGRGVGETLMEAIEDWARGRGCKYVYLRSNVIRQDAHRFYERIGYEILKTSLTMRKEI
jgi:GNAT superfamily N-acetyltransferase